MKFRYVGVRMSLREREREGEKVEMTEAHPCGRITGSEGALLTATLGKLRCSL